MASASGRDLLICIFILSISSFQPYVEGGFLPDCSRDCSGLTHHRSGIEFYTNKDSCRDVIKDLAEYPSFPMDPNSPLMDITITDYSTTYINALSQEDKQYENSEFAGVNITFKYNQDVSGKVTGVTFYRQDTKNEQPQCRGYRFYNSLDAQDVADQDGNLYTHFFDCIRGHKLGNDYEFIIKLESNSSLGSSVYRLHHRSPDLPLMWKPQYFKILHTEYEELQVRFELAPDGYGFNTYDMQILDADGKFYRNEIISVNSSIIRDGEYHGRNVHYIEANFTGIEATREGLDYSIKLIPRPSPNTCIGVSGQPVSCSQTESRKITVYEDPCKRGISNAVYCGKNEECKSLEPGKRHKCVCKEGYIKLDSSICEVNMCSTNPCGRGNCTQSSGGTYRCACNEGYISLGGTCTVNMCSPDNPCGQGNCTQNAGDSYNCTCDAGYISHRGTCKEDICATKDPCGPNSMYCDVLSEPICTCNPYYTYREGEGCLVSSILLVAIICTCIALIGFVALIIFCWGHPKIRRWFRGKIWASIRCNKCHKGYQEESRMALDQDTDTELSILGGNQNQTVEYKLIFTTMMKKANILILFAMDDPHHTRVVQAFTEFLQVDENKFTVSLPSMDILALQDQDWQYLFDKKLNWADKVIIVASQPNLCINTNNFKYSDKHYQKMINHIVDRHTQDLNESNKFQIVYFDNSSVLNLSQHLKHLPKYKLMKQMEALYFKLHDIEQFEPGKEKEAPWLSEEHYTDIPEGEMLANAIQEMKNSQLNAINNNMDDHFYLEEIAPLIPANRFNPHIQVLNSMDQHPKLNYSSLFENFFSQSQVSEDSYGNHFRDYVGRNPYGSDFDSSSVCTTV